MSFSSVSLVSSEGAAVRAPIERDSGCAHDIASGVGGSECVANVGVVGVSALCRVGVVGVDEDEE